MFVEVDGCNIHFNISTDDWAYDIAYNVDMLNEFEEYAQAARNGKGVLLVQDSEYNNPDSVLKLQMLLKKALEDANYEGAHGMEYTNLVTGIFDANTEFVVKWYQKRNNLEPDGKAGPATITSLCEDARRSYNREMTK